MDITLGMNFPILLLAFRLRKRLRIHKSQRIESEDWEFQRFLEIQKYVRTWIIHNQRLCQ